MPKVSVILTSYNHEKYIREAIDSVLAQTFTDFELIIWDDASSDGSWFVINSYSDPRIKAFCNDETRRGIYGINKAVTEVAAGEYIAIHHSDDVWRPEKLAKQVEFLDGHPSIGAVFTNTFAIGEEGNPLNDAEHFYSNIFDQPNRTRQQWLNHFLYHGNALCHPSVLIRKQCYQDCGLYRYGLAQQGDLDMWMRLCLKYDIHVMPEPLVNFRVRANEANASGNRPEAFIRCMTEFHEILKTFLRIETFDEMAAIFPETKKYYRIDGFEPRFILAMVMLGNNSIGPAKSLGIELLFDLMSDVNKAGKIKSLYNFDYRDLIKLTAEYDVFSLEKVARLNEEVTRLKQANTVIEQIEGVLREKSALLRSRDAHITNIERLVRVKDQYIINLEKSIIHLENKIRDLEKIIVDDKDVHIANVENRMRYLEKLVYDKDVQLGNIYSSQGWKLLTYYFWLRDKSLPEGTIRRRLAKKLFRAAFSAAKAFKRSLSSQKKLITS